MKKGFLYFVTLTSILLSIIGCERDDICVDTPITPFLTIDFRNADLIDSPRNVNQLQVTLLENKKEVFVEPITTNSINIPLDTSKDQTTYIFTRNVNDTNTDNTRSDTLSFSYIRNNIFVNRACGFKTNFSELDAEMTDDDVEETNWINNIEFLNRNVNNESDTPHVLLFH